LIQLHTLSQNTHINQTQLHLCFESTALRLLTGLGSSEFQFQLSRFLTEPKNLASMVSSDSEELNRVLVLTMSRSMVITGMENETSSGANMGYLMDLLQVVMKNTPHNWTPVTKQCFPKVLQEFYTNHNIPSEDMAQLKNSIEEEYRNWQSMTNENDIITYFSQMPVFLCVLFKLISDTGEPSPVAYKILERIGSRMFSTNLRKLCDFLLYELSMPKQIPKFVDAINDMIWKYNFVTIDRFVLCLALRAYEPRKQEMASIQVFLLQLLLIKTTNLRERVTAFVDNSPEYWKLSNYNTKHLDFQREFPEKFVPSDEHYPTFFGNVCLRFLPVLDIVIHRFLEHGIDSNFSFLTSVLRTLGMLYKFHDRPITYLYNTLFYYEQKLRDVASVKLLLIARIINSFKDVREKNWALTEQYQLYIKEHLLAKPDENQQAQGQPSKVPIKWNPELSYYMGLVRRLIESKLACQDRRVAKLKIFVSFSLNSN
jgi:mediator of RNA polymerase II transcription subunit 23